jgi:aminoglycoside phosphotransferase family enzyme/adenylate kinase family enzyme
MTKLINALLTPEAYSHPVDSIELLQTHISWIILTGDFAYKIKKPVNFGFLDFSSLQKRRHFCEEELRLNHRYAAELYLDVVTINGSEDQPRINGDGAVLEYAVKMQQFPSESLLSTLLDRGDLRESHIDRLANNIANFHLEAIVADAESDFGTLTTAVQPVEENFRQIRQQIKDPGLLKQLDAIEKWSEQAGQNLQTVLIKRKDNGYIRECHGDLHLGNIILWNGKIIPFDCIEFNENLRWIDTLSEIAFLVMDLDDHLRPDLARRLLNKYLEHTGDYSHLGVLQYYKVYRAMVRAKVHSLRLAEDDLTQREIGAVHRECENYTALASQYITETKPLLIIMHGFSGSGKTTISQFILEALPAIRIRSDIERKRLFQDKQPDNTSSDRDDKTNSAINEGIYSGDSTAMTYEHLRCLAEDIILSGMSVIVDAAFLLAQQRRRFRQLASLLNVPFRIIDCHAEHTILEQRITERRQYGSDASEATLDVLFHQQENHDPLSEDETTVALTIDKTEAMAIKTVTDELNALMPGHLHS